MLNHHRDFDFLLSICYSCTLFYIIFIGIGSQCHTLRAQLSTLQIQILNYDILRQAPSLVPGFSHLKPPRFPELPFMLAKISKERLGWRCSWLVRCLPAYHAPCPEFGPQHHMNWMHWHTHLSSLWLGGRDGKVRGSRLSWATQKVRPAWDM